MSERLDTHYWLTAFLRRCTIENIPAQVRFSGDRSRGSILLKVVHVPSGKCRLLVEVLDANGDAAWMIAGTDGCAEPDADSYIERARRRDPDLWVVEIEDRIENQPLGGRLIAASAKR